jgi:hypothetical protein
MAAGVQKDQRDTRFEHIVPRFYLRRFCDERGVLYVYGKSNAIRESIPERECAEYEFYEFDVRGARSENAIENFLRRIEEDAGQVIYLVSDRQNLSVKQSVVWASFVASLFARTRKVRAQISAATVRKMRELICSDDYVRELQHGLLQRGEIHDADTLRRYIESVQEGFEKSPSYFHATGIPKHTAVLAEALLRKSWFTIDAPVGHQFVTSDSPVITIQRNRHGWSEGAGFARENVVVMLPISAAKLFVASSKFLFKTETDELMVSAVNRSVVRFAHRNVYADSKSEILRNLVDRQINEVVFGTNAFLPSTSNSDETSTV